MVNQIFMRYIAIILLSFLSANLLAQESTKTDTIFNQIDHLNQKQGYWKKFYKNGKLAYHGFFKNDKPRGTFTRYHENGVISAKLIFSECGDTASTTLFNTLGREVASGTYLRTKKHGVWNYFGRDNSIVFTEEFDEGKKHGKFLTYYPSGQIYEMVSWSNDQKNGSTVQYYPDGKTKSMIFYKEGIADGPIRTYYIGGEVRLEGNYANGLKDGTWKILDPDGKVLNEIEYVQGLATNHDELVEKESRELEELMKNIGKIPEPSIEDFVGGGRY
jgi:antitoxin component YwqK of YwqJK toxin-antitoxin module